MRDGQFENIQKVFGVTGRFFAVAVGEGSRRTAISFVIWRLATAGFALAAVRAESLSQG